jgi:hypothetical protein
MGGIGLVVCGLAAAIAAVLLFTVHPTPASTRVALLTSSLHRIDRTDEFPRGLMVAFSTISSGPAEVPGLANPGADWQPGCMIDAGGPPTRRLLFGGCSDSACFTYFEHGNNIDDLHFVTFAVTSGGLAIPMESLVFPRRLTSLSDVQLLMADARGRTEAGWHEPW